MSHLYNNDLRKLLMKNTKDIQRKIQRLVDVGISDEEGVLNINRIVHNCD